MKYNKKQNLNILSIFLAVIMISGSFLYVNIRNNNQEKELIWKNLLKKTDIKGVSEQIDDDWNLYTNKALGFQLEYPRREFPYGVLGAKENRGFMNSYPEKNFPFDLLKIITGKAYLSDGLYIENIPYLTVGFHPHDSQGIEIDITQSKYNNLDNLIKDFIKSSQIPSQLPREYITKEINISGYDAVLIYLKKGAYDTFVDEKIKKTIFIIKEGTLYRLSTWYLTQEENERIWKSFKFLNK